MHSIRAGLSSSHRSTIQAIIYLPHPCCPWWYALQQSTSSTGQTFTFCRNKHAIRNDSPPPPRILANWTTIGHAATVIHIIVAIADNLASTIIRCNNNNNYSIRNRSSIPSTLSININYYYELIIVIITMNHGYVHSPLPCLSLPCPAPPPPLSQIPAAWCWPTLMFIDFPAS